MFTLSLRQATSGRNEPQLHLDDRREPRVVSGPRSTTAPRRLNADVGRDSRGSSIPPSLAPSDERLESQRDICADVASGRDGRGEAGEAARAAKQASIPPPSQIGARRRAPGGDGRPRRGRRGRALAVSETNPSAGCSSGVRPAA